MVPPSLIRSAGKLSKAMMGLRSRLLINRQRNVFFREWVLMWLVPVALPPPPPGRAYLLTDVQSRQAQLMVSGATAVTCLIKKSPDGSRTLYAANVGDR